MLQFTSKTVKSNNGSLHQLDESTTSWHLKSHRSLYGRSLHLTLVTKWPRWWSWMTNSHPFCPMSIGPPIFEIWLFQILTLKFHGQGHVCGRRSRSHCWLKNNLIYFFWFHINRPCNFWDTTIKNITFKIQGQGLGQGQTRWSYLRSRVQSICLLLVSWQWDFFWQRYSKFHI